MATIKKQISITPEMAEFLKTRRHISLSKICQAAVYEAMRVEGIQPNTKIKKPENGFC